MVLTNRLAIKQAPFQFLSSLNVIFGSMQYYCNYKALLLTQTLTTSDAHLSIPSSEHCVPETKINV